MEGQELDLTPQGGGASSFPEEQLQDKLQNSSLPSLHPVERERWQMCQHHA